MKTTTFTLGEVGDLGAPPGSKSWAIAIRLKLQSLLKDKKSSEHHIEVYLKGMEKHKGYEKLTDDRGHPFQNLDKFIEAKYPYGLEDHERIRKLMTPQEKGEFGKLGGRGKKNHHNNVMKVNQGNSKSYLLARLQRDAPDILKRYQQGEFRSVRAAAKAAGIVKDPTSLRQLQKWWKKANQKEREQFLQEVMP